MITRVVLQALRVGALCLPLPIGLVFGVSSPTLAQDDFFKPIVEATPTRKQEGPAPIFSFARLESDFRSMCKGLEEDGRRERIVSIAEAGVAREKVCITCRSFWKMVVSACGKLGPRPTPTPKAAKTRRAKEEKGESSEGAAEPTPEALEVVATPTLAGIPTATAKRPEIRYPSTEVLDETSRVSVSVHELDSGEGQTAEMLRYFAKTVRESQGLSAAEREYYDIFFTYLLAAWAGRVDSTKLPTPTLAVELDTFFE